MQSQTPLKPHTSQNLNNNGLNGVKSHLTKKEARIDFKRGSKKAIAQILPLIVLALIVVGIAAYVFIKPAKQDITQDEIQKIIDSIDKQNTLTADEKRDNADSTTEKESTASNTLPPTPTEQEVCTFSGRFTDVWVKQRTKIDDSAKGIWGGQIRPKAYAIYQYTGNCVKDIYLEMGITNRAGGIELSAIPTIGSFVKSKPSACDDNTHYYGEWYRSVKPNTKLFVIQFSPETPAIEGTYNTNIGAYTGCTTPEKDTTITEVHSRIKISDTYSEDIGGSASTSWEKII